MTEYEEIVEETFDLEAGTYTSFYSYRNFTEERKRWDRLIIEGIMVVDTVKPGIPIPSFIPAGEPERIWRQTTGKDPRWKVLARCFIWEKGGGPEGSNSIPDPA